MNFIKYILLLSFIPSFLSANLIQNRRKNISVVADTGGGNVTSEFFFDDFSSDPNTNGWVSNTGTFNWDQANNHLILPSNGSHVNTTLQMTSQAQWVCVEFVSTNSVNNFFHGSLLRAENNSTTPRLTVRIERDDDFRFRGLSQGNSGTAGEVASFGNQLDLPIIYAWTVTGDGLNAQASIYNLGDTWPTINTNTAPEQIVNALVAANGGGSEATLNLDGSQSPASGNLIGVYAGGSSDLRINRIMGGTWAPGPPPAPGRFDFENINTVIGDDGTSGNIVGDLDNDGDDEFIFQRSLKIVDWNGVNTTITDLGLGGGRLDRWSGDGEVMDVDNDGFLDIVITDSTNSGNVGEFVWFKNPAGNFGGNWVETSVFVWDGTGALNSGNYIRHCEDAVGDIDGDGDLDFVCRGTRYGTYVFTNNGDGTFAAPPIYLEHNPREGLDVVDVNADGRADIVINGIWFESGVGGTWTLRTIAAMADWYPAGVSNTEVDDYAAKVRVVDVNSDGRPDIVISNSEELNGGSPNKPLGIRVYLNPLNPVNDPWIEIIVEGARKNWHTLKLADFDDDGNIDIMAGAGTVGVGDNNGGVYIYAGNGDGTFEASEEISDVIVYQGEIGDIDNDGNVDILLPQTFNNGPVRLLRGR